LDEPTAGLDPESAHAIRQLLADMPAAGRTVVLSTHLLREAEGTADQLVMMDHGRVWEKGSPADLAGRYASGVRVRLDAENRDLLAGLDGRVLASETHPNGEVTVTISRLGDLPELVEHLVAVGARLTRVEPEQVTLERLYFRMRAGEGPKP
jgi:ABC-2 type transport system ATP-binding protein